MAEPLVHISHLYHHYEEGLPAISDISLDIEPGTFLAVIGHNGAGKTTLAKHLNGLLKPRQGSVCVAGMDTRSASTAALARRVGYVFQNPDHQIFSATVREEVGFGLRNLGAESSQIQERVTSVLQRYGLHALAEYPPAMLGYGLRRKVALASVLVMEPDLLVLDEPTVGLDTRSAAEILDTVLTLNRQGHTVVLITHDMRLVARFCSRCLVMVQGEAAAYGATRAVFADKALLARAGLVQTPITQLGARLHDLGMPPDMLSVAEFATAFAGLEQSQR